MKKFAFALGVSFLLSTSAFAADLPTRTAPAPFVSPVPAFTWAGFYVGANAGYAWGEAEVSIAGIGSDSDDYEGFIGGGQVGYNWQAGQFVFGVEADLQGSGIEYEETAFGITATSQIDYLGTVRGRLGFAVARVLPYVTGGFAFAQNDISFVNGGVRVSDDQIHTGWTVGAGLEAQLAGGWSIKGEYLYVDLGRETYFENVLGGFQADAEFHVGRVGLNYRF